jgi:hypothetical protein
MIEIRLIADAIIDIQRRLNRVSMQCEMERRHHYGTDWTSVAEDFESIRDVAGIAAQNAWLVIGEYLSLADES